MRVCVYVCVSSQFKSYPVSANGDTLTGMVTCRPRNLGSTSNRRQQSCLFFQAFRMVLGSTKPPVVLVRGAVSAGGRLFSAEVKNKWSRTYTPHMFSWRSQGRTTETLSYFFYDNRRVKDSMRCGPEMQGACLIRKAVDHVADRIVP